METYIRLTDRFCYDRENLSLIDKSTGEIHSEKNDVKQILETLQEDKEFNRSIEKQIRQDFNLLTELEKYQHNWKDNSWFVKIYRTEMREYKKRVRLSPSAGLLLLHLIDHIEYKTNKIINSKGKGFTNKELSKLLGMSENPTIKALGELEDKLFIKRLGVKRAREIYFNPYLASSGNEVSKQTLDMFEDYINLTPF